MRIHVLPLLLISVLRGSAFADDNNRADAEALFARADGLLGLGQPTSGPYTLRGHFHLVLNQPVDGTVLRVVLREREVWRTEVSFPGYSETVVRNGNQKWVRRSGLFTPRVEELVAALQPHFEVHEKEKVEKVTQEMVGSVRATCVKLKAPGFRREMCIAAATGLPFRDKGSSGEQEQVVYESYSGAGDKQFPANVRLTENDKLFAEFWLDSVSVDTPDKSLFQPLPDAVLWPVCDKMKPPVPISMPEPDYPPSATGLRTQGLVVVHLVIDEQGYTHDVAVTRSLTPVLDKEAVAAVSKWRFKPAICGDTPIPLETNLGVEFNFMGR